MQNLNEGTTYTSEKFFIKNTQWSVRKASGKINYVSILKITANPHGGLGKEFTSEDAAIANYKSIAMKAALIQIFAAL